MSVEPTTAPTTAGATTAETHDDFELEELSEHECRTLLSLTALGRIGFVVDDMPTVLPVNYRLVSDDAGLWVVLRTRPGNTIDRAPRDVAFEIDGVDYDNHKGWSVLVRGTMHHLDHNEIELLVKRFDPEPWAREGRSSWIVIKPTAISGRRLVGAELEWAYPHDAQP